MLSKIEMAYLIAERVHSNQSYDIFPYMYHIKSVANIAAKYEFPEKIIVGCILHDSIEDGHISYGNIKEIFGEEIAEIVFAVTDEYGRNRKERKAKTYPKIKSNPDAIIVKLCDRIANMEHSAIFSSEKYKMYQKEKKEFFDELYNIEYIVKDIKMENLFIQFNNL